MRRAVLGAVLEVGLGGAAVGAAVWFVLRLASVSSRPAYLVGVAVAALAVGRVVRMARAPVSQPVAVADDSDEPAPRGVHELIALEHRLSWGSVDAERFESRVRPLLVRIAAERLRLRHGIDHTRQPDRARSILGDRLWQLMTEPTDPNRRAPSQRALRRIVEGIERI